MQVRCPYCGSRDVAEIVYGYPDLNWIKEQERTGKRITLGGCCVSGEDPKYECINCEIRFGKPPVLRNIVETDSGNREMLPDAITGIEFSIGSFFDGNDFVEIVREGNKRAVCACHLPTFRGKEPFMIRELSASEWKRLMDKLFSKLFVHEWKQVYFNYNVLDGTQWNLIIHLGTEGNYQISGSNEFPPLFDTLTRMFRYYLYENVPLEMNPAKRSLYEHLFRKSPCLSNVIRKKFEMNDRNNIQRALNNHDCKTNNSEEKKE